MVKEGYLLHVMVDLLLLENFDHLFWYKYLYSDSFRAMVLLNIDLFMPLDDNLLKFFRIVVVC